MAAKLDPPNREMRRQIVAAKSQKAGMAFSEEITNYIADQVRTNVRELEGAINYISHWARSHGSSQNSRPGQSLTITDARIALAELLRNSAPILDAPTVLAKAIHCLGLVKSKLHDKSRCKAVSEPRSLLVYLLRRHTGASYSEIGQLLGGFNHSTMIAAERRLKERLAKDDSILIGQRRWNLRDAVECFESELGLQTPEK
jgi:chromosomal replication initiator protein